MPLLYNIQNRKNFEHTHNWVIMVKLIWDVYERLCVRVRLYVFRQFDALR